MRVDIPALVAALDAARELRGVSWRRLAAEAGVSASTVTRVNSGRRPDVDSFVTLLRWLGEPAERFVVGNRAAAPPTTGAAFSTQLTALLDSHPELDEADVELIRSVVRATLRHNAARR